MAVPIRAPRQLNIAIYKIMPYGGDWAISLNGRDTNVRLNMELAIRAAIAAAAKARSEGFHARVLILAGRNYEMLWRDGQIPAPPPEPGIGDRRVA